MPVILHVDGTYPTFGDNTFIAPNATIVGDVVMGNDCSIWFNAVIRGDVNSIRMGNKVNIQDGAVIHCTYKKQRPLSVIMFLLATMPLYMVVPLRTMCW
ncbi:hypothetical protein [Paraflavitalea speifideaquila]|uniref:gamma carbonic anhydrase family protein n=1 Tax=Paraflavitalea speifideaquila TaxID=3076558 RepID=UPI0028E3ABC8|nr:hypothetical protein [Paraflavitalea speifideiaquila]